MSETSRQIVLTGRPEGGRVSEALFELQEVPRPEPGDGEVLLRAIYLSLDPAMRGWISETPNYRDPVPVGEVMPGFTVSEVAASNHPDYAVGELVAARAGWRDWAVSDGSTIDRKIDPAIAPMTTALHVLGHTGFTRRAEGLPGGRHHRLRRQGGGLHRTVRLRRGGQLQGPSARRRPGGGARRCRARGHRGEPQPPGPRVNRTLLIKRARMQGFLFFDYVERMPAALAELAEWVREGKLTYSEDITDGLENAPAALVRLLSGDNRGKMIVKVGPEPETRRDPPCCPSSCWAGSRPTSNRASQSRRSAARPKPCSPIWPLRPARPSRARS
jgi:hypothetical protein